MANFTAKLEILVNINEPVAEINNVITAILQFHPGEEVDILTEVRTAIDEALAKMNDNGAEG
jgi:hypothetical protein